MLLGQQIGPFYIEKELGSGAMGSVYQARFDRAGKAPITAALKVVSLGLLGNESAMARFDREAAILKQLRHPHIVRLLATGKYRQTPFIAMEYVDGESMEKTLARGGRLSWEAVLEYGEQLCDALQYAHEKGIIHRDLKPSNLMLTREGVLKLTDFGIAKDTDVTALTGANSTIGTAAYMSPEQCKGVRDLGPRSDLYSLGIVFFELITGRKPFTAESTIDMFMKQVTEKPPRPSRLVTDLPPPVESLILHLLEKKPEDRPLDAVRVKQTIRDIFTKMESQASLGAAAASARRIDRPLGDEPVTEADREAARALKGTKKKKKKVKHVPFLQRTWVKAAFFGTAFAGMVVLAAVLLWPKGFDAAFKEYEAAPDKLEAAKRFLASYGSDADPKRTPQLDQVRAEFRDQRGKLGETQLTKRFNSSMKKAQADTEDQTALDSVWAALEAEKAGNLARAKDAWTAARDKFPDAPPAKYGDDDETNKAAFRWAADRRLKELAAVPTELNRLRTRVAREVETEERKVYEPTDPEWLAVKAVRLMTLGDPLMARRQWDQLAKESEGKPEKIRWYLMAADQRAAIPTDAAKEETAAADRLKTLTARLNQAEEQLAKAKAGNDAVVEGNIYGRKLRLVCRDLTELYPDGSALKPLVARAEKLLAENPK